MLIASTTVTSIAASWATAPSGVCGNPDGHAGRADASTATGSAMVGPSSAATLGVDAAAAGTCSIGWAATWSR